MQKFTIHGARGSFPACGRSFLKYGGHTTCYSLQDSEQLIIFDAGSGISSLGDTLIESGCPPEIHLFFTHFHLDHILGLAAFKPLYREDVEIHFWADGHRKESWKERIQALMVEPFWPIDLRSVPAKIQYHNLDRNPSSLRLGGVNLSWCPLHHPQECLSYRAEGPGQTVVIATDHEPGKEEADAQLTEFSRGADLLLADAHFSPEEYPDHQGWGHGSWVQAVRLAAEAEVKQLVLTHHATSRTDEALSIMVARARREFPDTIGARQELVIPAESEINLQAGIC